MKPETLQMLRDVDAMLVSEDDSMLTIQVVPGHETSNIVISEEDVPTWYENRISSRANHVGKPVRGGFGGRAANRKPVTNIL